ncbi:hypothetical protein BH10PLA2_BH10PLA2_11270 [soil metagenome]
MGTRNTPAMGPGCGWITFGIFVLIGGTIVAIVHAGSMASYVVVPLACISLGSLRALRWSFLWYSTPEERAIFALKLERDPLIPLLRDVVHMFKRPPDNPGK